MKGIIIPINYIVWLPIPIFDEKYCYSKFVSSSTINVPLPCQAVIATYSNLWIIVHVIIHIIKWDFTILWLHEVWNIYAYFYAYFVVDKESTLFYYLLSGIEHNMISSHIAVKIISAAKLRVSTINFYASWKQVL